jgi:hypothetical protein
MKDLFETPELIPDEVQAILDKFCQENNTYKTCASLVDELATVGYTCGYGLSAEPYGLRKLSQFDDWDNKRIEVVFECLLDEMSQAESDSIRKKYNTIEDKINYFILCEKKFENYLL